jgi:hypothetical protein
MRIVCSGKGGVFSFKPEDFDREIFFVSLTQAVVCDQERLGKKLTNTKIRTLLNKVPLELDLDQLEEDN